MHFLFAQILVCQAQGMALLPLRASGMVKRAKCDVDEDTMFQLLKVHVPSLEGCEWQKDTVQAVGSYQSLLSVLASKTKRIKSSVAAKAAMSLFPISSEEAKKFGQALEQMLSFCNKKSKQITTGKKLNPGVKAVIASFEPGKSEGCSASSSGTPLRTQATEETVEQDLKNIYELYGQKPGTQQDAVMVSSQESEVPGFALAQPPFWKWQTV